MKVILHKLFPYAPYLNEYIGFEDETMETESPLEAVKRLREMAEQSHRERYPHLYPNGNEATVENFSLTPTIDYSAKEKVEKAIEDATTPHELDLLMGDVAKHNLVPQYLEKKKSLK